MKDQLQSRSFRTAAVLVYLNSLANGFTYDDLLVIVGNPAAHHPGERRRGSRRQRSGKPPASFTLQFVE